MSNNNHKAQQQMNNKAQKNAESNQGYPIDADFVIKQYEAEVIRLTKENLMLKAYIAQGSAQKGMK